MLSVLVGVIIAIIREKEILCYGEARLRDSLEMGNDFRKFIKSRLAAQQHKYLDVI